MSVAYAVMVALVVVVLGAALYFTMQKRLADEMDRRLSVRADEVQYAQLVKANVSVAPIHSGLDGGMNKVFLARFPGRIISLAMVLPNGSQLPQLPPVPWADNDGSLANKFFGALFESKPASQTLVASTNSTTPERGANSAATTTTKPAPAD